MFNNPKEDCGCNKKHSLELPKMDFPKHGHFQPKPFEPKPTDHPCPDFDSHHEHGTKVYIENHPDEEDLTEKMVGEELVLKFKDKKYDPSRFSGMGKVFLRKNLISYSFACDLDQKNILTQEMFQDEYGQDLDNTIFIVQYDYDLDNKFISVPYNSIILFLGGSFANGTLILNNTLILPQILDYNKYIKCAVKGNWARGQVLSNCEEIKYFNGEKWLRLGAIDSSDIQNQLRLITQAIEELGGSVGGAKSDITNLETELANARANINGLSDDITDLEGDLAQTNARVNGINNWTEDDINSIVAAADFVTEEGLDAAKAEAFAKVTEAEGKINLAKLELNAAIDRAKATLSAETNSKVAESNQTLSQALLNLQTTLGQSIADLGTRIDNLQPGGEGGTDWTQLEAHLELLTTWKEAKAKLYALTYFLEEDADGYTVKKIDSQAILNLLSDLKSATATLTANYNTLNGKVSTNAQAIETLQADVNGAKAKLGTLFVEGTDDFNWNKLGYANREAFIEALNHGGISEQDMQKITEFINNYGNYLTTQALITLISTSDEAGVNLRSAFTSFVNDKVDKDAIVTTITNSEANVRTLATAIGASTEMTSKFVQLSAITDMATKGWVTQQNYISSTSGLITESNVGEAVARLFSTYQLNDDVNNAVIKLISNSIGSEIQITADKIDLTGVTTIYDGNGEPIIECDSNGIHMGYGTSAGQSSPKLNIADGEITSTVRETSAQSQSWEIGYDQLRFWDHSSSRTYESIITAQSINIYRSISAQTKEAVFAVTMNPNNYYTSLSINYDITAGHNITGANVLATNSLVIGDSFAYPASQFNVNGSGSVANGAITWDDNGVITVDNLETYSLADDDNLYGFMRMAGQDVLSQYTIKNGLIVKK